MKRNLVLAVVGLVAIGLLGAAAPAEAQLGGLKDRIKKKAEDKAAQKAEEAIDQAVDGEGEEPEAEPATEAEGEAGAVGAAPPAAAATGGRATADGMTLYTKYDFIPGDRVIFYDDLAREEMGEFPSRWRLDNGVFEVVRQGEKNYIMCSDEGRIRPRIPVGPLPPRYTLEVEFYSRGNEFKGHWYYVHWFDAEGNEIGNVGVRDGSHTHLRILDQDLASKELTAPLAAGHHTLRIMATATTMKCYVDHERVANVPAVEGFQPVDFAVHMDPWPDERESNPMLLGTVRYAEGGKTLRQQLDETGRIVTHGILFDSGSAKIKAESYKTLADLGALLTGDPALRLSIEGHTDSDGAEEANLKLSQDRAGAVMAYLVEGYKVDAARLESSGHGEAKPIDTNESPEGKANNRRVELVKL